MVQVTQPKGGRAMVHAALGAGAVAAAVVSCCLTGAGATGAPLPLTSPVEALAPAEPDFDADGFADLAVSGIGEEVERKGNAGQVTVLYGSTGPLGSGDSQQWDQSDDGVAGDPAIFSHFGETLATGDFDADGFDDLAVGSPDTADSSGIVQVLFGSTTGLVVRAEQWFAPSRDGLPASTRHDELGTSLASADLDADGYDDLAMGARGWSEKRRSQGAVHVLYGGPGGLSTASALFVDEEKLGEDAKSLEGFGSALVMADLDGDELPELVIGAPYERFGGYYGAVFVIPSSPDGPVLADARRWTERTPGVPGRPDGIDLFGSTLATGDVDGDGSVDLAVGGPGDGRRADPEVNPGAVWVFPGSTGWLTPTGVQRWGQGSQGVLGRAENSDSTGQSLIVGDYDGDGYDDLVFASPGDDLRSEDGHKISAGTVNILYGSVTGLQTANDQLFTQDSPGVPDRVQNEDRFGRSLGTADLDVDGHADLLVGAPWDGDRLIESGAAFVFYGSRDGLAGESTVMLRQGAHGVPGTPSRHGYFGYSFGSPSSAGGPGPGAGSSVTARQELSRAAR